jgi:hypothetical protein
MNQLETAAMRGVTQPRLPTRGLIWQPRMPQRCANPKLADKRKVSYLFDE